MPHVIDTSRGERQARIHAWAKAAFTVEQATSLPQRALRLLEETLEACQACGVDSQQAHCLIDFVYGRPVGELGQELGGVGVCVLALAAAAGLSAEQTERNEVARVLAKPVEEFRDRNAAKNAAGFLHRPQAVARPGAEWWRHEQLHEGMRNMSAVTIAAAAEDERDAMEPPMSEGDLDRLRGFYGPTPLVTLTMSTQVHPLAMRAVREIRRLRAHLDALQVAAKHYVLSECDRESTTTDDYTIAATRRECAGDTHDGGCSVAIARHALISTLAEQEPTLRSQLLRMLASAPPRPLNAEQRAAVVTPDLRSEYLSLIERIASARLEFSLDRGGPESPLEALVLIEQWCLDLLAKFRDGGEAGETKTDRHHETQQGATTPGQGATAQGAARRPATLQSRQLGPTPDRTEPPPSHLPELRDGLSFDDARAIAAMYLAESVERSVPDWVVHAVVHAASLAASPPAEYLRIPRTDPHVAFGDYLDELDRLAQLMGCGPRTTLALTARIRELKEVARRALEGWDRNHLCEHDFKEVDARQIENDRMTLENGI